MLSKINSFQGEYRFLSNFWLVPIVFEGITFPSVEHAYQAAKTLEIGWRHRIASLQSPGKAKRVGRLSELREDWEDVKLDIMEQLVLSKFSLNNGLRFKLLETGGAELIEGNNWGDTYWGEHKGVGKNHLGKILMKVRYELRNG
ncbi:MAG TPA: NADAR family protein [bacterium]|nr:NADAR family protein [bacterium]